MHFNQKCFNTIKIVLIPLGFIAAASAADAGIHKKILKLGFATLIISNEEVVWK